MANVPRPTLQEIEAECQRIQESWSERERLRRAGLYGDGIYHWYPPGVVRSTSRTERRQRLELVD